ncbi:MAG: divalent-cation tolerance protein CutA [Planctomycetota bacterium]
MKPNPSSDHELCIGFTTLADREQADRLAARLVQAGLAACVQIDGPIISHYHWDGQSCRDEEFRLVIKTTRNRLEDLRVWIENEHPYDQPQWLVIAAIDTSPGYAKWAAQQCDPESSGP